MKAITIPKRQLSWFIEDYPLFVNQIEGHFEMTRRELRQAAEEGRLFVMVEPRASEEEHNGAWYNRDPNGPINL